MLRLTQCPVSKEEPCTFTKESDWLNELLITQSQFMIAQDTELIAVILNCMQKGKLVFRE
jgi:hypothetical protein